MPERFAPIDRETIENTNVLLLAPDTYPIVVGIDTRKSRHSLQTIVSLPLTETIKPCPQMPNVVIKDERLRTRISLIQLMSEHSQSGQNLLAQLVAYNVVNHLNDQRVRIEPEQTQNPQTYLYFIRTFTSLPSASKWKLFRDALSHKDEGHMLSNLDAFIARQSQLEHDPKAYVTGENCSAVIWQRNGNC